MKGRSVDAVISEISTSLKKHFIEFKVEFLVRTPKSLKAHVHLDENLFIAVRYNARNERMDFALIQNDQRIFGYDNLKKWHRHPYGDPSGHVPCDKPTIEKIISDIKAIYATSKGGED